MSRIGDFVADTSAARTSDVRMAVGAVFDGRAFVTPDDIKRVALPALRHRVLLDPAEEIEGGTTDEVLTRILDTLEVPR